MRNHYSCYTLKFWIYLKDLYELIVSSSLQDFATREFLLVYLGVIVHAGNWQRLRLSSSILHPPWTVTPPNTQSRRIDEWK